MNDGKPFANYADIFFRLDEGERRAVVQTVCSSLDTLGADRRRTIVGWLENTQFNGFRSYAEAPPKQLCAAVMKAWRNAPPFWGFMLRAWLELRPDVADAAVKLAKKRSFGQTCECDPAGVLSAWSETTLSEAATELAGKMNGLSARQCCVALLVTSTGDRPSPSECHPHGPAAAGEDATAEQVVPMAQPHAAPPAAGVQGAEALDEPITDAEGGAAEMKTDESANVEIRFEVEHADADLGMRALSNRIDQLGRNLTATAKELREEAKRLEKHSRPDRAVAQHLIALEEEFGQVQKAVSEVAGKLEPQEKGHVAGLRDALRRHDERIRREGTLTILHNVLRLRSTQPLAELDRLQARVRKQVDSGGEPEAAFLAAVGALLTLCSPETPLDHAEQLVPIVEAALGPRLALAANRGWIRELPPDPRDPPPNPQSRTSPGSPHAPKLPADTSRSSIPESTASGQHGATATIAVAEHPRPTPSISGAQMSHAEGESAPTKGESSSHLNVELNAPIEVGDAELASAAAARSAERQPDERELQARAQPQASEAAARSADESLGATGDAAIGSNDGPDHAAPLEGPPDAERREPDLEARITVPADVRRTATALAQDALEMPADRRAHGLAQVVWALVGEDRLALAHAVALGLDADDGRVPSALPSALVRGLTISPLVTASDDAAALQILQTVTQLDIPGATDPVGRAKTELMAAMALQPALLSPASGATGLLQSLDLDATGNLVEITDLLVKSQGLGLAIGPGMLVGLSERNEWQARLEQLQRECATWMDRARQSTLVYAGATDVWRRLLEPGSELLEVLEPVLAGDINARATVRHRLDELTNEKALERMLRALERDVRGRAAVNRPITSRAYLSLLQHTRDALSFPARWLELLDLAPQGRRDANQLRAVEQWRTRMLMALNTGKERLASRTTATDFHRAVSWRVLLRAIEGIGRLFERSDRTGPPVAPEVQLVKDLLRVPEVAVASDWSVSGEPAEVATRVLRAVAAGLPSWEESLAGHMREQRFLSVKRIIALAEEGSATGIDVQAASTALMEGLRASVADLQRHLKATQAQVESAVALDLLREDERLEVMAVLEGLSPERVEDFGPPREELARIEAKLADRREERVQELRARVDQDVSVARDPAALRRIRETLDRGDIPTATEYLDAVARNEPLVISASPDVFKDYFPRFVRDCTTAELNLVDVARAMQSGQSIAPLDLAGVAGAQREEAGRFLRAWGKLKSRTDVLAHTKAVLEGVGFRNVTTEWGTRHDARTAAGGSEPTLQLVEMTCTAIQDRDICVIPQFGSQARGRYRVVLAWNRPTEEDILNFVPPSHGMPALVLYLGRMTDARRRELAHASRRKKRQLLLIDETMLAFLAMQRGSRLPVLFQCGLPFTVAEPYPASAGYVPVEMFFGRRRERQAIMDPLGTSLVYGGRQLGKTALLRHVERNHHAPERGVIVRWVDLKQAQIGFARPTRDLWEVIGGILEQEKVVSRRMTDVKNIQARVKEWLNADSSRRIVLLLDEADHFLTADREDSKPYTVLLQLKQLLDETEKRVKFVLAGLHDVQRTSRDPNSPLAHLGTPVCIGPLLGGGEALEARALIELPLHTLGYRFDSPDLPTRILSHTNYYPSLIQLFCGHLLDHVSNTHVVTFDPKTSPPYVITAKHVEDAYQSQALRDAIRDRFTWTLDLDLRYKLIALLIALDSLEDRHALAAGFSAAEVRSFALSWWSQGFPDQSLEGFRTILDEMVGLGLLRKASPGTYALRSANVLNLLGSKAEIEAQIEDLASREPPKPHEHPHLRRQLNPDEPWRRSPLTFQQEARLLQRSNGACVLFGPKIADREEVSRFIQAASPDAVVETYDGPTQRELELQLNRLLESRHRLAFVVVAGSPWTEHWVDAVHRMLTKRQARDSVVRVVFVGDPAAALRWVRLDRTQRKRLQDALGVETVTLAPWTDGALRAWFEEAHFGPALSADGRHRVHQVTGGWSTLVHRFGDACKAKPLAWEEHLQRLAGEIDPAQVFASLELPSAVVAAMRVLSEYQGIGALGDVAAEAGIPAEQLQETLELATLLNIASAAGETWSVDPIVTRAIEATAT